MNPFGILDENVPQIPQIIRINGRKKAQDSERQWTGVKRESTVRGFRSGTI